MTRMKSCQHCGIVPYTHKCPVAKKIKNENRNNRADSTRVYRTTKWNKTRLNVLDHQDNTCLWSLYVEGKIRPSTVAHHIVEIDQDMSIAFDYDNLIGVAMDAHRDIHKLYKIDKAKCIRILKECNVLWSNGVKLEGLGMLKNKVSNIKIK